MTAFAPGSMSSRINNSGGTGSSSSSNVGVVISNGGTASSRLAKLKGVKNNRHNNGKHQAGKMASSSSSSNVASGSTSSHRHRVNDNGIRVNENGDELVLTMNPFLNDFIDCIENLPNRLQLLLSELRSVDVLSNGKHSQ